MSFHEEPDASPQQSQVDGTEWVPYHKQINNIN